MTTTEERTGPGRGPAGQAGPPGDRRPPLLRRVVGAVNVRQFGMVIALAAIMLLFQVLVVAELDQNFLTPRNISNVIVQNSFILILAIGMMLVIINGHIDLSVGSVLAFTGAVSALAASQWGLPWWLAVLAGVGTGALIGAWQGFWVAYVRIPAFIVTLAGMLLFRGLTLKALGAQTVTITSPEFRMLGSGYWGSLTELGGLTLHVPSVLIGLAAAGTIVVIEVRGRARRRSEGIETGDRRVWLLKVAALVAVSFGFCLVLALYRGIPVVGLLLLVLLVGYTFLTNRTVFGRHIYAGGGNEKAALLSGVRTRRTTFWVFVNMGVLAGLAGVVFTARLNSATPDAGTMFELHAIASAFIGGASMSGGVGTVPGAVVGGMVMGVMRQGMSTLGVSQDMVQVILGLVVLAAVFFDVWNKKRASGRA